jgi:hypothetical protein
MNRNPLKQGALKEVLDKGIAGAELDQSLQAARAAANKDL